MVHALQGQVGAAAAGLPYNQPRGGRAMSTDENSPRILEQLRNDLRAVADAVATGRPVDPEVADRVRARATQITEEIRRTHGEIDDATFQSLLQDEDDEVA
jgi:hypothetical protein